MFVKILVHVVSKIRKEENILMTSKRESIANQSSKLLVYVGAGGLFLNSLTEHMTSIYDPSFTKVLNSKKSRS